MLTEDKKILLEQQLYPIIKKSLEESEFFNDNNFMQYEAKSKDDDSDKEAKNDTKHETKGDGLLKASDYKDMGNNVYGKMKTIVPILTSTYDDNVNTYNLTHSQLSYEMYDDLDPDTARSKFSQKVTGKKRFTSKEINKLFNKKRGKIA